MSQLFESYEQDYSNISASITRKITSQLPSMTGEQRKTTLRAIERELDEGDEILQSMEMELNSFPPSTRTRLQPRLRNYRSDYDKLKSDYKKASDLVSDRSLLLQNDENESFMDQRARLLEGTNKLTDASRRLEDSHRLALETEQLGIDTLGTLRNQRQQILRATESVRILPSILLPPTPTRTHTHINRSFKLLKDMSRRAAANRVMSIGIIIVLIFCIILILVLKFQ